MKCCVVSLLILLAGCVGDAGGSGGASSPVRPTGRPSISKDQLRLSGLKDSFVRDFGSSGSEAGRQNIVQAYQERLETFLLHHTLDSMAVTIDQVVVNGKTVTTKSHFDGIQFQYALTFSGTLSPRIDSVFTFMKGLPPGSDTLINFSYTGACRVNRPDSGRLPDGGRLPVFDIFAFPIPLSLTGR